MKICQTCKQSKDHLSFHKNSYRSDGLHKSCKECRKEFRERNKIRLNKQERDYYKKFPWKLTLKSIKDRCTNSKDSNYKWYGGKGIECLITNEELKFLWFRDEAYLMKKPSIDRLDNDGNYYLENCRYIELGDNVAKRNHENFLKRNK